LEGALVASQTMLPFKLVASDELLTAQADEAQDSLIEIEGDGYCDADTAGGRLAVAAAEQSL